MLLAALRLNIPTVFVSGGPMEAGKTVAIEGIVHDKIDLIDAMIAASNDAVTDDQLGDIERSACPTCGSCSGMFTANSMNCLTEAIGLALPGNGSTLATHAARKALFDRGRPDRGRDRQALLRRRRRLACCPAPIATRAAFENAVALDVAMGGSTNTVLHLLAAAREAELDFDVADIDAISRRVPCLAKVAPNSPKYHMEDVHRAGGIPAILGELHRAGLLNSDVHAVHAPTLDAVAGRLGHPQRHGHPGGDRALPRRARRGAHHRAVLHQQPLGHPGHRRRRGLHPRPGARLLRRRRAGDPARQPRPRRLRGQDRRRPRRAA